MGDSHQLIITYYYNTNLTATSQILFGGNYDDLSALLLLAYEGVGFKHKFCLL